MGTIREWAAPGAGGLAVVAALINMVGLVRLHLRNRHAIAMERERSARIRARSALLAETTLGSRTLRVVERDADGERTVEVGRSGRVEPAVTTSLKDAA